MKPSATHIKPIVLAFGNKLVSVEKRFFDILKTKKHICVKNIDYFGCQSFMGISGF